MKINLNKTNNHTFLNKTQLGIKVNELGNAYVCFLNPDEKGLTSKEAEEKMKKIRGF